MRPSLFATVLYQPNRIKPIDSFPLFPGVQSIPSHRSLALGSSPSAIGRRGAAWSRLSSAIGRRGAAWSSVALSDQRDQRGSMQRLSTAVTDVLHVQLLSALHASSVLRDCSDQRGDAALVDHGAVPVLRRCLRDAQHAVTCCDSMLCLLIVPWFRLLETARCPVRSVGAARLGRGSVRSLTRD